MDFDNSLLDEYRIDIKKIIPQILQSIVEIYGEKHRPQIEKMLQTIVINNYITYKDVKNNYLQNESHFKDMLTIKLLKRLGMDVTTETEDKVYKDGSYYLEDEHKEILTILFGWNDFSTSGPIYDFDEKVYEETSEWQKKNILNNKCKILEYYGLKIEPETYEETISSKKGVEVLSKVRETFKVVQELNEEYKKWKKENERVESYIKNGEDLEQKLELNYIKKYYLEILPFLPKEQSEKIKEILENTSNEEQLSNKYSLLATIDSDEMYFAYGGFKSSILGAFQEEYDIIINDDDYNAKKIREKRIKYFKLKGIDLGDDYSLYEKSEDTKKVWPDKNMIQSLKKIDDECIKKRENEFFLTTSNYIKCKEDLSKIGLCIDDTFSLQFVEDGVVCIAPNLIKNEQGEYESLNIMHFPILSIFNGSKDVFFLHEILHVVEMTLGPVSNGIVNIKTGLEEIEERISEDETKIKDDEDYKHELREFENLSENIHHNVSILVTENLHDKGIYIFDDPKRSKTRGTSDYEHLNVITANFIKEFRKEIIDGMILPNIDELYNSVGKHNLQELNRIVKEYYELPYYKMMDDVINNKDTELVRKRNNLIENANEIIEQMKEFKIDHNKEYQISTSEINSVSENQSVSKKIAMMNTIKGQKEKIQEGEQII